MKVFAEIAGIVTPDTNALAQLRETPRMTGHRSRASTRYSVLALRTIRKSRKRVEGNEAPAGALPDPDYDRKAPMVYRGRIDQVPARDSAGADGPASVFADHDCVVMGARFVLEAIRRDS
ncbi:MAG TPA: hypothetical protein ENH55_01645 [Aurantimonas coralicida]|uniref:Uncharacterized protein n=1 Tax=Aurantimonas coralicida TaxID=182270 RepID=A0A9C9NFS5_9HYPH|nr:hypothetical protein [Aurantimonas coralicida]HEU00400.1 hypothetical protein [Aurantimonas coralicida]